MLTEIFNNPYTVLAVFFVSAVIAVASLLGSMKHGGSSTGIIVALIFAGIALYVSPSAFALIGGSN